MRLLALLLLASAAWPVHAQGPALVPGFGGETLRVPVRSLASMRTGATVLQQYDFSCGSAAVATLLTHHYGHAVSEQDVLNAMYATGDQAKIRKDGFSLLDMKRYLQGLGYAADGFQQTLDRLAEARLPAIVLVNDNGYQHFVVVKGLRGDRILVGDPARGTLALPRADFEKRWVGGLLFVVHSHVQQARFNRAEDWRAAPAAPLLSGVQREAGVGTALPRHNPGDF